jgi:hypothetical protein
MIPPLPEQRVSENKKQSKDWQEKCIRALVGRAYSNLSGSRSSREAKQINYDLFNSIINLEDFSYVTKPYGVDVHDSIGNLPANFQDYNIVRSSVLQLVGEELKRPFQYKVISTAGEGFNQYLQDKTEALQQSYLGILKESLGEPNDYPHPEEVEKHFSTTYTNNAEITANRLLKHNEYALKLKDKFIKGFRNALISAEEVYYAGIWNNTPVLIPWNTIHFECDKNQDTDCIEDCDWAVGRWWVDRGQVLDFWGDRLTPAQKDMLRSAEVFNATASYGQSPEVITTTYPQYNYTGTKILMQLVCWKSEKKIGTLTYIDDRGEVQKTTVDENFQIPPGMEGEMQVEWFWIPRTWEGVQIGPEIFLAYEAPYQFNTVDNPYKSKLPFIGRVYSNLNSKPTSLVDLIKPYQYLYNIIWYRLELEFAKAKGKKFVMDVAQLPKSKGWTVEQWIYYFDTLGIAFINSKEEGREGDEGSVAKFNQFTGIDMSLTNAIQGYFTMLSKIEECVENITGITRQRKGQINTSETVGGVERSVMQSNALTEIYFHEHSMVKEKVLEHLLELSKICYSNNEQGKLVFDEFSREMLDTKGLLYTDFGLYVNDSVRENGILEQLKGVAKDGISSGALDFSNIITLLKSNSVAEVEQAVRESEKIKQQQQMSQSQTAQAQIESNERMAQEALDREDRNKQLDRENKIQIAEIGTLRGKDGPSDLNQNSIPDAMEVGKLALEQSREEFNQEKESNKLSLEMEKLKVQNQQFLIEQSQQNKKNAQDAIFKQKELQLKEEDIAVKKKALKYKAKPTSKK